MRLLEAILDANRRRTSGDRAAAVDVAEQAAALPLAALTCIDVRLNHLLPDLLGLPEAQFIWLRNAGNIITGPFSSTMRSLAMACAIKGAREITIIGHSDCQVGKTTAMQLLDRLAALGVERHRLPENLVDYFGLFGSERQNVMRAVEFVRASPLIGAQVPVHGLLIDVKTGRLESVINGYEGFARVAGPATQLIRKADETLESLGQIGDFAATELKLPDTKIGELMHEAHAWLHKAEKVATAVERTAQHAAEIVPPVLLAKFHSPRAKSDPPPRRGGH